MYTYVRNATVSFFKPILEMSHFFFYNFTEGITRLRDSTDIYKSHEKIKTELTALRQRLTSYEELQAENDRLSKLLNFQKTITVDHISAQVIGRDVSPWSNWILINVGYISEATKDVPLIAPGGLVGRIASVGFNTSHCMLIIDHQSRVSAIVQQTRDLGIIQGTGYGLLRMNYLALNSEAKIGDTIVTSGLGGVYPKGLPVGTITIVGKESNGMHLFAKVKPFVDFSRLEEVLCLKKSE